MARDTKWKIPMLSKKLEEYQGLRVLDNSTATQHGVTGLLIRPPDLDPILNEKVLAKNDGKHHATFILCIDGAEDIGDLRLSTCPTT